MPFSVNVAIICTKLRRTVKLVEKSIGHNILSLKIHLIDNIKDKNTNLMHCMKEMWNLALSPLRIMDILCSFHAFHFFKRCFDYRKLLVDNDVSYDSNDCNININVYESSRIKLNWYLENLSSNSIFVHPFILYFSLNY